MKIFSIQEVANILGVSAKTLRRWEEKGILKPHRTPGNQRRYTQEQIDNFRQLRSGLPPISTQFSQITPSQLLEKTPPDQIPKSAQYWTEELVKSILVFKKLAVFAVLVMLFVTVVAVGVATLKSANLLNIASLPKILSVLGISKNKLQAPKLSEVLRGKAVLGADTSADNLIFGVNVQSEFADSAQFLDTIKVAGIATLSGGVITENQDVNAGTGKLTASNVLYGAIAGEGIAGGPGQTPTITNTAVLSLTAGSGISVGTGSKPTVTNTGVLSLGGSTGSLDLKAGTGISVSGLTITNSDTGTSQNIFKTIAVTGSNTITASSNTDSLTFTAGTGIALSSNSTTKAITIAGAATSASWQENANALSPFNIGDDVLVGGTTTASAKFGFINVSGGTPTIQISGNSVLSATTLGTGVITSSLTTVGTIGTGVWQGTSVKADFGGTGVTTYATGDLLYSGSVNPTALSKLTIGNTNQVLTVSAGIPSWADAGTQAFGLWQTISGAIQPKIQTQDLLLGGTATASAKFAVLNVNSGTPTASVSAQNAAASALVLGSDSTIQSVKNQTLTIGGETTGNITLSPLNGSGTVTSTGNLNLLNGKEYQIAGNSVLTASTLGSGVTTSSRTAVGTITTGVWQGTAVGLAYGGTNNSITAAAGAVVYSDSTKLLLSAVGSSNQCFLSGGAGAPTWGGCALGDSTNWWTVPANTGVITPINQTLDFLLGSTTQGASTSAKFAVLNINSGTPTASISAGTAGGSYLNATGTLSTTAMQTLTLGGSTTGNIVIDSGSSSITLSDNLTLSGTTITASSLTTFTGGATAIDFTEFDVSGSTGAITINDGGDLGNISIEGTVLDINSLDFVGAGTITSGGSNTLTLDSGNNIITFASTDTTLSATGLA